MRINGNAKKIELRVNNSCEHVTISLGFRKYLAGKVARVLIINQCNDEGKQNKARANAN